VLLNLGEYEEAHACCGVLVRDYQKCEQHIQSGVGSIKVVGSCRDTATSGLPTPVLAGSPSEISHFLKRTEANTRDAVATQATDEALLAASYIHVRFRLDGKSDIICNQDITFIEKLFKEHPNQQRIREHYRTAYDKVQNEWLPDHKWIHLVSIFPGYFGIVMYPDLPEGTPVILPDKTGEDSLLSTVSRLPGVFVPRERSPFPPPSPESSLSDSVYEPPGVKILPRLLRWARQVT